MGNSESKEPKKNTITQNSGKSSSWSWLFGSNEFLLELNVDLHPSVSAEYLFDGKTKKIGPHIEWVELKGEKNSAVHFKFSRTSGEFREVCELDVPISTQKGKLHASQNGVKVLDCSGTWTRENSKITIRNGSLSRIAVSSSLSHCFVLFPGREWSDISAKFPEAQFTFQQMNQKEATHKVSRGHIDTMYLIDRDHVRVTQGTLKTTILFEWGEENSVMATVESQSDISRPKPNLRLLIGDYVPGQEEQMRDHLKNSADQETCEYDQFQKLQEVIEKQPYPTLPTFQELGTELEIDEKELERIATELDSREEELRKLAKTAGVRDFAEFMEYAKVLALYTSDKGPYRKLNTSFRDRDVVAMPRYLKYLYMFETALFHLPTITTDSERPTVFRGGDWTPDTSKFRPGAVVTFSQITSCSRSEDAAKRMGSTVLFRVVCFAAKSIKPFSLFPHEDEVVFPLDSRFYVRGLTTPNNNCMTYVVDLEQVPSLPLFKHVSSVFITVVLGITGAGKSEFLNTIAGSKRFYSSNKSNSVTPVDAALPNYFYSHRRDNQEWLLADTPGLADTDRSLGDVVMSIITVCEKLPYINLVCFVTSCGRLTPEATEVIQFLLTFFPEFKTNLAFVITKADSSPLPSEEEEEEYYEELEDNLKTFENKLRGMTKKVQSANPEVWFVEWCKPQHRFDFVHGKSEVRQLREKMLPYASKPPVVLGRTVSSHKSGLQQQVLALGKEKPSEVAACLMFKEDDPTAIKDKEFAEKFDKVFTLLPEADQPRTKRMLLEEWRRQEKGRSMCLIM